MLEQLHENNLYVSKDESKFFQKSVRYFGHIMDKKGLHKTDEEIAAELKAPKATNVKKLK